MKILFSKTFIKKVKRYEVSLKRRIIMDAISKLPCDGDIKKLKGQQLKNLFRLRVGKYRVIFMVRGKEALLSHSRKSRAHLPYFARKLAFP